MKSNARFPANKTQLKASVHIHEMIFNNARPTVHISPNGSLNTFTPWKSEYQNPKRPSNWLELQRQSDLILCDLEKCIECNPDHYVMIAGMNDNNIIQTMHLMHEPQNPSCPIPMVQPSELGRDGPSSSI